MDEIVLRILILRVVLVGCILAVIEFFVVAIAVDGGGLVGFHTGLMAGIFMIITTVVIVFLATAALEPEVQSDV